MTRLLVITSNRNRASFRCRIGVHLDRLRSKGIDSRVAILPRSLFGRARLFASAKPADVILLQRKMLSLWDAFWLRRSGRNVIFDFDDAVMYADDRPEQDSALRLQRFGQSVRLSHLVIAGNEYLADHARRHHANVRVLPTGLDLTPYRLAAPRGNDGRVRLVWIGSGSTLRYLREIAPALDELARGFPNVVLRMICDEFFDLRSMPVERRPWSQETEAADLTGSDIGLAPLPDNRFTRGKCGFKILQYQAAGLPVVASPVGVNAQYVRDGITGFLARDAAQWVDQLGALAQNPQLRTTLGQAGQRQVEQFDLNRIGEQFCCLIKECLEREDG